MSKQAPSPTIHQKNMGQSWNITLAIALRTAATAIFNGTRTEIEHRITPITAPPAQNTHPIPNNSNQVESTMLNFLQIGKCNNISTLAVSACVLPTYRRLTEDSEVLSNGGIAFCEELKELCGSTAV